MILQNTGRTVIQIPIHQRREHHRQKPSNHLSHRRSRSCHSLPRPHHKQNGIPKRHSVENIIDTTEQLRKQQTLVESRCRENKSSKRGIRKDSGLTASDPNLFETGNHKTHGRKRV